MFGYIRPQVPELKVKDHELYRAIYCGLCRSMGRCTGCLSRFTLNYDFVFLAAVLLVANGESFEVKRGRCMAHPIKARAYVESNETLSRVSSLSALLCYYKVEDDIADSKGIKKLAARLVLPALRSAKKRAKNPHELETTVKEKLSYLSELEKKRTPSPDAPASVFGELLGEIARAGILAEDEAMRRIMYSIGYHTGRWIYAIDAVCDMADDQKSGSYNPYLLSLGDTLTDSDRKLIESSLRLELCELEKGIALLPLEEREMLKDIIENILYAGLPAILNKNIYMEDTTSK